MSRRRITLALAGIAAVFLGMFAVSGRGAQEDASTSLRWEYGELFNDSVLGVEISWVHLPSRHVKATDMDDLYAKLSGAAAPAAVKGLGCSAKDCEVLTLLGAQGWELVSVERQGETSRYVLKRKK